MGPLLATVLLAVLRWVLGSSPRMTVVVVGERDGVVGAGRADGAPGISPTAPSLSGLTRQSALVPLARKVFGAREVRRTAAGGGRDGADPRVKPEDDGGCVGRRCGGAIGDEPGPPLKAGLTVVGWARGVGRRLVAVRAAVLRWVPGINPGMTMVGELGDGAGRLGLRFLAALRWVLGSSPRMTVVGVGDGKRFAAADKMNPMNIVTY